MTITGTAAAGACLLIAGVAAFQLALAFGLPLGDATFGGRAPTEDGALKGAFRLVALTSALVLAVAGWIILARAGVVGGPFSAGFLTWATWGIVAFLALNTLGNFSAPHPVERWVMGSASLLVAVLGTVVALTAD